jgi:hypothetical protein
VMRGDILSGGEIQRLLQEHMPQGEWMTVPEIYRLVQSHASFTPSDWEPDGPRSTGVRWKRNVRNVLQKHKSDVGHGGMFEWNQDARSYRLA